MNLALLLAAALALAAPTPVAKPAPLIAVGDAASCSSAADAAASSLALQLPGTLAMLGDAAYETGSARDFADCYAPTWGRLKARTRPAVGNHEYGTPGAAAYFDYFGARAGVRGRGWYAYRLGAWTVIVLNSNCGIVSCARGSAQERWLRTTLAHNRTRCTLAYWHHPRFSSGLHGDDTGVTPFWQALYAYGADVVLNGHDHVYERFAPQTPSGRLDRRRGIREFVVGTGGRSLYPFVGSAPNTEARNDTTYGVLRLQLGATGYSWRFVGVPGSAFTDAGSASCR